MHKNAIRFEKTNNARTYLLLNEIGEILAYFSLSFKEISLIGCNLSKTEVKKLDGLSKNSEKLRGYLIGQIAKDSSIRPNPLDLNSILSEAYAVIDKAQSLVGGSIIIIECEDNPKLISLYEGCGFKSLEIDSRIDHLKTMYILISIQ